MGVKLGTSFFQGGGGSVGEKEKRKRKERYYTSSAAQVAVAMTQSVWCPIDLLVSNKWGSTDNKELLAQRVNAVRSTPLLCHTRLSVPFGTGAILAPSSLSLSATSEVTLVAVARSAYNILVFNPTASHTDNKSINNTGARSVGLHKAVESKTFHGT